MPTELIICIIVFILLTLAGAGLYIFKYSEDDKTKPTWQRVIGYIYHIVLGAPYIIILGISYIIDKIRNIK